MEGIVIFKFKGVIQGPLFEGFNVVKEAGQLTCEAFRKNFSTRAYDNGSDERQKALGFKRTAFNEGFSNLEFQLKLWVP